MSFVEFLVAEFNSTSTIRTKSSTLNSNLKHKLISTLLIVLSQLSAALVLNAQLTSIVDRIHRKRRLGLMSLLDVTARVERIGRHPGKSRRFWVRPGRTNESLMKLCDFIGPFVEKQTTSFRVTISVEKLKSY